MFELFASCCFCKSAKAAIHFREDFVSRFWNRRALLCSCNSPPSSPKITITSLFPVLAGWTSQPRQLEVPPASSLPAQRLCVSRQVSVWSVAEKPPGEAPFYRIELKHLTPLYNRLSLSFYPSFKAAQ